MNSCERYIHKNDLYAILHMYIHKVKNLSKALIMELSSRIQITLTVFLMTSTHLYMGFVFWKEDKTEKYIGLCVWIDTVRSSLKPKEKEKKKNHPMLI